MIAGQTAGFFRGHIEVGIAHTKGFENPLVEKLLQRLTAESLYQRTQHICRNAIVIAGAWLKAEWEGAKVLDKGVQIGTVLQCSISISSLYGMLNVPAIREARSMGHQLLDGHRIVGCHQLSVDQQRHAL